MTAALENTPNPDMSGGFENTSIFITWLDLHIWIDLAKAFSVNLYLLQSDVIFLTGSVLLYDIYNK